MLFRSLATNALPCEVTFQGETTIFAYEVSEEPPHLNELSHYGTKNPYQVMNFDSVYTVTVNK